MVNQDRVVLITGGTSGIGRAAATALARQGGTIIVVGRDEGRCRAARDAIRQESGNHQVEAIAADLAEGVDVVRLAGGVLSRWDRLDVLINNAGRMIARRERTSDSLEMTFALNHLGYFLLTNLLRDGENVIGAILGDGWAAGHIGWYDRQRYIDRPRLLAQLEITTADDRTMTIATDRAWNRSWTAGRCAGRPERYL